MNRCRLSAIELDPAHEAGWLLRCRYDSDLVARSKYREEPLPQGYENRPPFHLEGEFESRGKKARGPWNLELCCGLGHFLADLGATEPGGRHLGIDYARPVAERAARHLGQLAVPNAMVYLGRLEDFFDRDGRGSLFQTIFINFPDPWPKNQHRRRRVVRDDLVARLLRALAPGGRVITATDVKTLHEEHREVLSGGMAEVPRPDQREVPHPVYGKDSVYAKKGRAAGREVYYTVHGRRGE